MTKKTFEHPLTASLHDIDAAGVMFFAHYFRHAHDAYETFMAHIGYALPEMINRQIMLPLVHSEADLLRPVRHGEKLTIKLSLERIGRSSFTVDYRFIDQQGQIAANLKTTHVMLNPGDRKSMALPEALRESLTRYNA